MRAFDDYCPSKGDTTSQAEDQDFDQLGEIRQNYCHWPVCDHSTSSHCRLERSAGSSDESNHISQRTVLRRCSGFAVPVEH